jgi:hypothetical protein
MVSSLAVDMKVITLASLADKERQWLARPPGIELNLRKSARHAIIFNLPALARGAHFA